MSPAILVHDDHVLDVIGVPRRRRHDVLCFASPLAFANLNLEVIAAAPPPAREPHVRVLLDDIAQFAFNVASRGSPPTPMLHSSADDRMKIASLLWGDRALSTSINGFRRCSAVILREFRELAPHSSRTAGQQATLDHDSSCIRRHRISLVRH